jgi:hypothetical protein
VVTTPQAAPPEEDAAKEKLAYATQLENTLTAPWENLFQIIETVPVPGVAMLEFATDTATRDIVLAAEARDIAAMHLYLEQVGAAPGLGGVHLAVHHVQPAGLSRSVRFSVNASWRALRAQAGVRTEGGT